MNIKQILEQVVISKNVGQRPIPEITEHLSDEEHYENYIDKMEERREELDDEFESLETGSPGKQFYGKIQLRLLIFDNYLKIRSKEITHKYLNNNTMMILAAGMIPAILLPYFLNFGDHLIITIFEWINYFILLIFLIEFVLKLYVAESKVKFFNFWHTIDLFILVVAGLEFTPLTLVGSTYSPLLRLLRLVRAFAVAGKLRTHVSNAGRNFGIPVKVTVYNGTSLIEINSVDQINTLINDSDKEWIDIQQINFDNSSSSNYLEMISGIINTSKQELKNRITKEAVPGIYPNTDFTIIFIKDLKLVPGTNNKIKTVDTGITILLAKSSLITISPKGNNLQEKVYASRKDGDRDNRIAGYLYDIFSTKVEDYREIISEIDKRADELEVYNELNYEKFREKNLKGTFRLKKDINAVYQNLKRLNTIISSIIDGDSHLLIDISTTDKNNLRYLAREIKSLEDSTKEIKENLSSMVEWHMNTVSFEMNGVMKVLTLITCLSVIPGIVTGFFGENIIGSLNEFNITIFEVFVLVAYLMIWSIVFTYFKGWLK